jgi:hypothetical protein
LLTESEIFKDEILPGTERTDKPSQEMPEQNEYGRNHDLNLIGTPASSSFQVIHPASARGFDEGQGFDPKPLSQTRASVAKKIESTGKADFSVVYATRMEFLRTTGGRRAV